MAAIVASKYIITEMSPPFSIIIFTVLSGAGLGLAVLLATLGSGNSQQALWTAAALSSLLIISGLGASVGHLANPKNAWRAFMRVRTSWLSREAVLATLFFPVFFLWVLLVNNDSIYITALRVMLIIVASLTIFSTAMIYQSLKPIPQWHHPLTAINYLLLALMSGALLLSIISVVFGIMMQDAMTVTVYLTVAAVIGKITHYWRIGKATDITIGHATGYSQAAVRLLDAGHTSPTFLTREFVRHYPATLLQRLRITAILGILSMPPLAIAALADGLPLLAILWCIIAFAALLLERWLFFAEAKHTVRLYHGDGKP